MWRFKAWCFLLFLKWITAFPFYRLGKKRFGFNVPLMFCSVSLPFTLSFTVPGECCGHSVSDTRDLDNSFISPHRHNSKVHTQNITSNLMNVGVVRLHGIYDILLRRLYINAKESICQSLSLSSLLFMKSLQYRKPNVSSIISGVSWAVVTAGTACPSEPTQ